MQVTVAVRVWVATVRMTLGRSVLVVVTVGVTVRTLVNDSVLTTTAAAALLPP